MDTFKEHQELTHMFNSGHTPWEVWKNTTVEARGETTGNTRDNLTFGGNRIEVQGPMPGAHSDDIEIGCGGAS